MTAQRRSSPPAVQCRDCGRWLRTWREAPQCGSCRATSRLQFNARRAKLQQLTVFDMLKAEPVKAPPAVDPRTMPFPEGF